MPIEWTVHKRAQKDINATWATKHRKYHFSYKLIVNVVTNGVIITTETFFADKGYVSQPKEKALAEKDLNPRVQHKKSNGNTT
jgi:hypothetical protein